MEEAVVDVPEFGLKVLFDGGGMEAGHAEEVLRVIVVEGVEAGCGGTVDVGQEHGGDAGVEGAGDGLVAVLVEGLVVEVAVGVYELGIICHGFG